MLALVLLAAIDLATAHGSGHYTGSILHARSAGDLRDVIVRRYTAAWRELKNHAMPLATALALACAVAGVRLRERLLAPVARRPRLAGRARRRADAPASSARSARTPAPCCSSSPCSRSAAFAPTCGAGP